MAKRLKRWVDRLLIVIAVFYAAALVLPYHPDPALANQYHLCSNEANFVITADRRLVAWDVYDDHHVTPGMPFKPYFLRKTVIRDAAQVQTSYGGGMALDRSGTLWGWGIQGLLVPEEEQGFAWSFNQPVKLIEDVQDFSIAWIEYGAVILKTDGSLWIWGKYYQCPKPLLLAEDIQKIGANLCFIDEENTCWKLENRAAEGQPRDYQKVWVADNIAACTDLGHFYLLTLEGALCEGYKNLAARGYSTEQIEKTLTALKNAAAFGRQASYSLGDAVSTATEGLKNENSILVDNTGVTKNVSVMWKEYAQSIGVGVNSLTKAQKIQAEVNGILEETRFQTGDAAKLVSTYSGQVAMLGYNFQQLKVQVGNAIMPIVQAVLPGIKGTIVGKIDATMKELLGKDWLSIGKGIVDGIMNGLKSIFERLRSWVTDVWGSITSAFSSRSITPSYSGGRVSVSAGYRMANMLPEAYSARNLPHLANGAVIPPNQQFAAILGDQRNGTNLELPEGLLRRAIREEMSGMMTGTDVNISFNGSLSELAKVLQPAIKIEERRRGPQLARQLI